MKKRILLFVFAIVVLGQLSAQTIQKITGFLGEYHTAPGYSYADSTGTDSVIMQYLFRFGEIAFPSQAVDNGFDFVPDIDSCSAWHANRIVGIIQPPTEHGVPNQPADTDLFAPYPQLNGPGMIQAGQRFSRLSQMYGGFSGVILDDWAGDSALTGQIRDAVQGKYVDDAGNVYHQSIATTPYNKLYCVVYSTAAMPEALPVIDGVCYYNVGEQNCCASVFDSDITALRLNYPGKEIQLGIYLKNSGTGWLGAQGVQQMLSIGINRYDDGDINAVTIFAGVFLVEDNIPLNIWNAFDLPHWLDSLYYPYLGEGEGKLYDCITGRALSGGFVRVFCEGRLSGDTLMRSRQMTDANGNYDFGLWAGNRNTDSTYYWLVAEKPGYFSDTVGFWIKRGDTTTVPSLSLCPDPGGSFAGVAETMALYPNPTTGSFVVESGTEQIAGGQIEVYNMVGAKIYAAQSQYPYTYVNLPNNVENGMYVVVTRNGNHNFSQKNLLVVQR